MLSRFIRSVLLASGLCLMFTGGPVPSLANDVPLPLHDFLQRPDILGYNQVIILVVNFGITVFVEYLVICSFLGWPIGARAKLFFGVLFINVITNPLSQLGAIFLGRVTESEPLAWAMLCIIELAAAAVEFVMLERIFGHLYRLGVFDRPITTRRTILITAVANLASFFIGFVGLILLLIDARS